ncbi:MAG: hypothetical protein CMJ31_09190 [Phycisphaerae bacterium]|nr:hypothetical protein [Phycisphaerae bacterium]
MLPVAAEIPAAGLLPPRTMGQKDEVSAMATVRAQHHDTNRGIAVARGMLNAFDNPALLADDSDGILAANAPWHRLFADPDDPSALPPLSEWLARLDDGDALAAVLCAPDPRTACIGHHVSSGIKRYLVRVTSVSELATPGRIHCVVMAASPPSPGGIANDPRSYTRRLLVRQTLIEERERRRLGRALHDRVSQLLVQVRRQLADARDGREPPQPVDTVADIDRVIHLLHELTSNFSPPVLEDLGLLPAIQWLADHLQSSHGSTVSCEDDGLEPQLSSEVRTIAFRALRELANNAVKHAPGARVVLRSSTGDGGCWLEVCDDGPGIDCVEDHSSTDGAQPFPGYGLLSIEQQIRAVGGTFEILTAPGEGTQAIITLGRSSDADGKARDNA